MLYRVRNRGFLVALVLGVLALGGCVRYIDVPDEWPWEEDGYLPSTNGRIVSAARVKSRYWEICENKSQALATDKVEAHLSKVLESFEREWRQDGNFKNLEQAFQAFSVKTEFGALESMETVHFEGEEKNGVYECVVAVAIKLNTLLAILEESSRDNSALEERLHRSVFYEKIKREAKKI